MLHSCTSLSPGKKQRSFHRRLDLTCLRNCRKDKTRLTSWISEDWLDIRSWNCGTAEIGQEAQREPLRKRKFRTWWEEARGRREHGIHGGRRNLSPIGNWLNLIQVNTKEIRFSGSSKKCEWSHSSSYWTDVSITTGVCTAERLAGWQWRNYRLVEKRAKSEARRKPMRWTPQLYSHACDLLVV